MQIAPTPTALTRKQLCKTIFYATPDGQLVAVLGNAHMIVSPEEAEACFQRLLDSTALYRQLLTPDLPREAGPTTGGLVANGVALS